MAAWIQFFRAATRNEQLIDCIRVLRKTDLHAAARWVRDRQRDENSCSLCGALKTGSKSFTSLKMIMLRT